MKRTIEVDKPVKRLVSHSTKVKIMQYIAVNMHAKEMLFVAMYRKWEQVSADDLAVMDSELKVFLEALETWDELQNTARVLVEKKAAELEITFEERITMAREVVPARLKDEWHFTKSFFEQVKFNLAKLTVVREEYDRMTPLEKTWVQDYTRFQEKETRAMDVHGLIPEWRWVPLSGGEEMIQASFAHDHLPPLFFLDPLRQSLVCEPKNLFTLLSRLSVEAGYAAHVYASGRVDLGPPTGATMTELTNVPVGIGSWLSRVVPLMAKVAHEGATGFSPEESDAFYQKFGSNYLAVWLKMFSAMLKEDARRRGVSVTDHTAHLGAQGETVQMSFSVDFYAAIRQKFQRYVYLLDHSAPWFHCVLQAFTVEIKGPIMAEQVAQPCMRWYEDLYRDITEGCEIVKVVLPNPPSLSAPVTGSPVQKLGVVVTVLPAVRQRLALLQQLPDIPTSLEETIPPPPPPPLLPFPLAESPVRAARPAQMAYVEPVQPIDVDEVSVLVKTPVEAYHMAKPSIRELSDDGRRKRTYFYQKPRFVLDARTSELLYCADHCGYVFDVISIITGMMRRKLARGNKILGSESLSYHSQVGGRYGPTIGPELTALLAEPTESFSYGSLPIRFFSITGPVEEYNGSLVDFNSALYVHAPYVEKGDDLRIRVTLHVPSAYDSYSTSPEKMEVSKIMGVNRRAFSPRVEWPVGDHVLFRLEPLKGSTHGPFWVTLFDNTGVLGCRPFYSSARCDRDLVCVDPPFYRTDIAHYGVDGHNWIGDVRRPRVR